MEADKRIEIKGKVEAMWDDYEVKSHIAKQLEHDYIFGEIASNEHYKIDEIMAIVKEVDLEKNPLPVVVVESEEEEPVIE